MKTTQALILSISVLLASLQVRASGTNKVTCFTVNDVSLLDSRFRHAQEMDRAYLSGINPDRLLAPYRKAAGLEPRADNYPNWENTGLDGHIGGHYLSALAYMYAATGDDEMNRRLDYMLSELKECQDQNGDGYLCGAPDGRRIWNEISQGNIKASEFSLNGGWVPLYNIHKTYAGLRDAYLVAGKTDALPMLVRLTDWMAATVANLGDEQLQDMLRSEHGGLNEVFADVAAITGQQKYLDLARRFSHRKILEPLLASEDKLTGIHANTQIPKVIGYQRIAGLTGDEAWSAAARFFWDKVVNERSVAFGGNSVEEHFHPADDFGKMLRSEQGPETCNTYNMLRLTKMLYEAEVRPEYTDYYERALYNHILTTINPVQGGFVYFTPVRSGHYRVYSQPQTSFWCCVGSGMENHARYGEMIYAHDDNDVYVNLFIPSRLRSGQLSLTQRNAFPEQAATTIVIDSVGNKDSRLRLRVPGWLAGTPAVTVNGCPATTRQSDGYLLISQSLHAGDTVRYTLPMAIHAEQLPDKSPNYAFMYGPVLLGLRGSAESLTGHFADESRGGHIANGPLLAMDKAPVIVDDSSDPLSHIEKTGGDKLHFRITGVYPADYEGATLEPFYDITDRRYTLYWPVLTQAAAEQRRQKLALQEQLRIEIDSRTIDKVTCGEQQPESDHGVRASRSSIGTDYDRHWRETAEQFGYTLRNPARTARSVQVTYRPERGRSAIIYVNGIATEPLPKLSDLQTHTHTVALPEGIKDTQLEISVKPEGSRNTPHIYELRLLAGFEK